MQALMNMKTYMRTRKEKKEKLMYRPTDGQSDQMKQLLNILSRSTLMNMLTNKKSCTTDTRKLKEEDG